MESLQEDYLESYKKAMLWNVILYSNTSMIGMVFILSNSFIKRYELHLALFPMNLWKTSGHMLSFWGIGMGLGEFFFFCLPLEGFIKSSYFKNIKAKGSFKWP